ncbi:MAG TPA: hypothetical protein VJ841_00325 [Candidatus Saccharimonadales bacterium]|nr:hypothetical protein [Candidatus Saccharimonadales bacterium]
MKGEKHTVLTKDRQKPELTVRRDEENRIQVEIFADPDRTIQIIQHLRDRSATPNWEARQYDGLLAHLDWKDPYLNGKEHVFTAEAQTSRDHFVLTIGNVSIGYRGGAGPAAAAIALAHLGIAELAYLQDLLCKPQKEYRDNPRDSWMCTFVPSDFGEKYS